MYFFNSITLTTTAPQQDLLNGSVLDHYVRALCLLFVLFFEPLNWVKL